jgi:hypothetical protein
MYHLGFFWSMKQDPLFIVMNKMALTLLARCILIFSRLEGKAGCCQQKGG